MENSRYHGELWEKKVMDTAETVASEVTVPEEQQCFYQQ